MLDICKSFQTQTTKKFLFFHYWLFYAICYKHPGLGLIFFLTRFIVYNPPGKKVMYFSTN